jgi:hypothetical protein
MCWPVSSDPRVGAQTLVAYACVKRTPCDAKRSIAGVWITSWP